MGATGEQTGMANLSSQDRDFLMDAAMGGLDDHSKANTELTTLATSKGITLPTALDEKH